MTRTALYTGETLPVTRDLSGLRVHYLTVLEQRPSRKGVKQSKVRWLVRCDCGKRLEVDAADLYRTDGKGRVSCGCMNHRRGRASANWKSPNSISQSYWSAARTSASVRGLIFEISIEEAFDLIVAQEYLCALSGEQLVLGENASLDRIDSNVGYIKGNVQWVDKTINRLKSNFQETEFINLCRKVVKHHETER